MPSQSSPSIRGLVARTLAGAITLATVAGVLPDASVRAEAPAHLLIAEIATGGAGANDEFIELVNPSLVPLPLSNVEVAYVSASGATVSQRVAWGTDAPHVSPGGRVLLANEAGVHAALADRTYAGGLAATGGTVIIRMLGSAVAIDAVGWGTAAGTWLEGSAAPAPAVGSSIERLTDAQDGRMQDTNDNAADFVERLVATPEGGGAAQATVTPMPSPSGLPTPDATASSAPTALPSPVPSPTVDPLATPTPIAAARAAADGATLTVEGTALTGSGFHDGGGYLADAGAGIAVIVEGGSFAAGSRLRIRGVIEDRFAQRTLRAQAEDVQLLGEGIPVEPMAAASGSIGEQLEGGLVRVSAIVRSGPTTLATSVSFELDDGAGPLRVVVGSSTGIDTAAWASGTSIGLVGVVGQRDSSGTGTSGYRVMPRSAADILRLVPASTPTPAASPSPVAQPTTAATSAPPMLVSIAMARQASPGTSLTLRGVVTMPAGVVDVETAVIQDNTAAIVVRVEAQHATLRVGDLVEVRGVRSTLGGMETLRATAEPLVLATTAPAVPVPIATVDVSERLEAQLVLVGGYLAASARRAASGTVTFDVRDEVGSVRVVISASLAADDSALVAGALVEVVGVIGQETSGSAPLAGYRIWPRTAEEVRVVSSPSEESRAAPAGSGRGASDPQDSSPRPLDEFHETSASTLVSVGTLGLADLRVGATLVVGGWPELAIGGLLWDGERLVAIAAESAAGLSVLDPWRPPVPIAVSGLRLIGSEPRSGVPLVALGTDPSAVSVVTGPAAAPRTELPGPGEPASWVTLVGRAVEAADGDWLEVGGVTIQLEIACGQPQVQTRGVLSVTGIGLDDRRVIVPCGGVRAAPTLAGTAPPAHSATGPRVTEGEGDLRAPAAPDPRRRLAAWLLALGVLVFGMAALAWRRYRAATPPQDDLGAEDDEEPADPATSPGVPHLTLVRLRREGGS